MPRGRPKKNPLPTTETTKVDSIEETEKTPEQDSNVVDSNEVGTEINVSSKGRPKKDDTPRCVCCKEPVYSGRKLNLSLLTSLASYHFTVEDMQPCICNKCASDLGEVIDKWLIKHGAEVKPYYRPMMMAKKYDNLREDNLNG